MPRYSVTGHVSGSKHLGVFEAETAEKAVEMALESEEAGNVCLCHQCSDECEDPQILDATASKVSD